MAPVLQVSWAAFACGMRQTGERACNIVADRAGSGKQSSKSGREHREGRRKKSGLSGKGRGQGWA